MKEFITVEPHPKAKGSWMVIAGGGAVLSYHTSKPLAENEARYQRHRGNNPRFTIAE